MFRELRNKKKVNYKLLNDKGMEDAMKSKGELKSRKLVAVDSGEMDEEALEKLKREQKKKEKDNIKKEKKKEIIPWSRSQMIVKWNWMKSWCH